MTSRPPALPIDATERVHVLDVLRGFALLGMFVVHFHINTTEPGGLDDAIRTFVWRFVETKSHGTFALLFGAGFAIQLRRAAAQGRPFAAIYLRRLAVLAAFGFAAHAFFGYNVLLGYAVWGVPLLFSRSWSTRTLLIIAVLSAASVSLYNRGTYQYIRMTAGEEAAKASIAAARAVAAEVNGALEAAEAQASYAPLLTARLRHMQWFYSRPFSFLPGATLALFIAGFLLIRHRVFERPLDHRRLLGSMAMFGVVSWAVDNWLLDALGLESSLGLLRDQWLTFTYVSGALLLLTYRPWLVGALRPVACAGRMALTNYLLQIAALDVLFSGYGVGLGRIRPVVGFAAALACFAIEVALSTAWLTRFRFGPAEWVWRSLTYGTVQPLRREAPPPARAVPG